MDGSESSAHDTTSDNDGTIVNSSETNFNNATTEVRQALKGDNRGVFMWRTVVKSIMIVMAVLLTTATYVQLSRSEERAFKAAVSCYFFRLPPLTHSV
jgi:hypothetical protein